MTSTSIDLAMVSSSMDPSLMATPAAATPAMPAMPALPPGMDPAMATILPLLQPQTAPRTHPEIAEHVLTPILWTLIGLDIIFVTARMSIRWKAFSRWFWDDFFVLLAFSCFLAAAITWQVRSAALWESYAVASGKMMLSIAHMKNFDWFEHTIAPQNILFYSALWSVKLSFIMFFRQFGRKLRAHAIWWWIVLVITILGFIGCIADIAWNCALKDFIWRTKNCTTFSWIAFDNRTFYANCGADVGTDLLIMSIPFAVLWNIRLPIQKKVLLLAIFGITVFDMIIAVIRITVVHSSKQNSDIAWLYFWSFVEVGTAICIACVASFRQLFIASHGDSNRITPPSASSGASSKRSFLSFLRSGKSMGSSSSKSGGSSLPRWGGSNGGKQTIGSSAKRLDSLEEDGSADGHSVANLMPLQNVHVQNSFNVSSTSPDHAGEKV